MLPGNYSLDVQATPMLRRMIMNITQMFPSATSSDSLYDEWKKSTQTFPEADEPE